MNLRRARLLRVAWRRGGAALLILSVIPFTGLPQMSSAQEGYSALEFSIARRENGQVRPRVSGMYVVWQDYRNLAGRSYGADEANADIYGRTIDGDEFKVTSNGTSSRPAISGNRVVYTDSRNAANGLDIRGYNIESGNNFDVVERAGDQDYSAIDGDWVVWQDKRSGNWDIRGYNIAEDRSFEVSVRDGDQVRPAVSYPIVVWEDRRNADGPDIFLHDLQADDPKRITENNDSRDPSVSGDWITWRQGAPEGDQQRVVVYNWRTGERRNVTDRVRLAADVGPRISGNLVVWADYRNDEDYNIWGYDIATGTSLRISGSDRDQVAADVSNTVAVWQDSRGDSPDDIRGARLTVPASATPTPAVAATPTPGTSAPPVSGPPAQEGPCFFQLGFKLLRDQIPDVVGDCIENEWHNADNGDALQRTTGGLMVWRKADNWTAFTNGSITWLNGPCGLQTRPNEGPFYAWEGKVGAGCI